MALINKLANFLLNVNDVIVENIDFGLSRHEERILTFDVRPYKRLQRICPHCGRRCPGYDRGNRPARTWRALDCCGTLIYLRYAPPRIQCPEHGVVTAAVPWAYAGSRFTKDFDMQTAWLACETSKTAVTKIMRIDWETVGRCMDRAKNVLEPDSGKRLNGLRHIGVDETSYTKGHNYITVVIDHDTNRVVWVHEGHGLKVFSLFFESLTAEQKASIEAVSGDGARWIDECIAKYVPNAVRCVDPFHVVQWAGESLDQVRREIWQTLRTQGRKLKAADKGTAQAAAAGTAAVRENEKIAMTVKKSTFALGKAPENLTPLQSERLQYIAETQPLLFRAYRIKEALRLLLKFPQAEDAGAELKKWYFWATHSRIDAIKKLAYKIRRHESSILNTIRLGLSNARIEANNNLIKLTIRRAFGFRNLNNLISMVMLVCSDLRIPLPNRGSRT